MAVTVQQVLDLALPVGSRLVGGKAHKDREVSWVCTLRVQPPAFEPMEGSEMVLMSLESLNLLDSAMRLPVIIRRLSEEKVSAIAVVGDVPPDAIPIADKYHTPLLSMPAGTRLQRVEKAIISLIVDQRAELERRGVQIYRQLAQLEIEDKGLRAILGALAQLTGKTVALQNERFELEIYSGGENPILDKDTAQASLRHNDDELRGWLRGSPLMSTSPPITKVKMSIEGMARFVAPVIMRGAVAGYISVIGKEDELNEIDQVAAGRGASVCAIEMAKQRAIIEAENRMRGDFVEELLAGDFGSDEEVIQRGKLLGYELSVPYAVLSFGWDKPAMDVLAQHGEAEVRRMHDALEVLAAELVATNSQLVLGRTRNERATLLCRVDDAQDLEKVRRLTEQLRQQTISRASRGALSAGVSSIRLALKEITVAGNEAEQSLDIAQRLFGGNRTVMFQGLGIYRLLFPLRNTNELSEFYHETLAKLAEYDHKRGTDLVPTLAAFFSHNGNLSKMAESLYLHRNTLVYRIDRIQDITGLSLDNGDDRLRLQLALKIKEIL